MEAEEITKEERLEELQSELGRRLRNAEAFKKQHLELLVSLKETDVLLAQRVRDALEDNQDASPKGLVDKVLQLTGTKKDQLLNNIKKVKVAHGDEVEKVRRLQGEIKAIKQADFDKECDAIAREIEAEFFNWLKSYKDTRRHFYDVLIPIVLKGFDHDPQFFKRVQNKSVMVSLESHFRRDLATNMEEIIEKILNLSDAYTPEPLLEKTQTSGTWPDNPESYFGYEKTF